ncbi:MAG: WecB/TagA/CpsF family glycosyltransferase [Kiritimatiellae bacterium]|nr:WecB/TagA/CpsF family glycosyltransferase [Kiritimatiellia bacterium]
MAPGELPPVAAGSQVGNGPRFDVLGVRISAVNLDSAAQQILDTVLSGRIGHVCVTGVHGVMECRKDPVLLEIHNHSLLTVPDGMPLVWIGRRCGQRQVGRVYGPDLVRDLLRRCSTADELRSAGHFWAGTTQQRLEQLVETVRREWPGVRIAGCWAPPYRLLEEAEWQYFVRRVRETDASLVWIGLSTPRQERVAAELALRLRRERRESSRGRGVVVIGVGAAFDILAGARRDAPRWIQRSGLQWAYRLLQEPRRLAPRYLRIVPAFLCAFAIEQLRRRLR